VTVEALIETIRSLPLTVEQRREVRRALANAPKGEKGRTPGSRCAILHPGTPYEYRERTRRVNGRVVRGSLCGACVRVREAQFRERRRNGEGSRKLLCVCGHTYQVHDGGAECYRLGGGDRDFVCECVKYEASS
jgi:hypothetical protein